MRRKRRESKNKKETPMPTLPEPLNAIKRKDTIDGTMGLDMDALIARDLNSMSLQDREEVFFDLHGVSPPVTETSELIIRSLAELQDSIAKTTIKPAYELAQASNEEYVKNPKFLLKFLRAERFDVHKAASRLLLFFECKMELFGSEKLTQEITIDDLGEGGVAVLESGFITLLPLRDRAGRCVFCMTSRLRGDALNADVVSPTRG